MLSAYGAFAAVANVWVPPFDPTRTVPLPSPSSVTVYVAPRSVCILVGQVGDISLVVLVVCSPMADDARRCRRRVHTEREKHVAPQSRPPLSGSENVPIQS